MAKCKNFYQINSRNAIYIENQGKLNLQSGSVQVDRWRRVIYLTEFSNLKTSGECGGGVFLLTNLQAIPRDVFEELMRKLKQAVDEPGICVKLCQDFHMQSAIGEETSLILDIFGPKSEPVKLDHDEMLTLLGFESGVISTLDAPPKEHICRCHAESSFLFFQCDQPVAKEDD